LYVVGESVFTKSKKIFLFSKRTRLNVAF
jgi:hypothetical protein